LKQVEEIIIALKKIETEPPVNEHLKELQNYHVYWYRQVLISSLLCGLLVMNCEIYQVLRLEPFFSQLLRGSLLHDKGIVEIPIKIAERKGRKGKKDKALISKHPEIGYLRLKSQAYSKIEYQMILYHHERLNGSGYPYGLYEERIPLEARVLMVADTFAYYYLREGVKEAIKYMEIMTQQGFFCRQTWEVLSRLIKSPLSLEKIGQISEKQLQNIHF